MSVEFDEMDGWFEQIEVDSPLHDAMVESLNDDPLAVSDDAVNRVAASAQEKLAPANNWRWYGLAGLVAAAALAALIAGQPISEVQDALEPDGIEVRHPAASYEVASAEVIADHRSEIARRLDDGDAYGAWQLFQAFRSQYGPNVDGMEQDLRKIAVSLHAASRQTNDPDALDRAGDAYALYLQDHGSSENAHAMRYAYGEMLYKAERHDEAYDQYATVVRDFPDSQHAKFCAESAIFAADQMIARGESGWEAKGIEAAETWLDRWPDDPKARQIRYKAAYLHYTTGDHAAAESQFTQVIADDPTSPEAGKAADLILDGYVVREDWTGLADSLLLGAETYPEALGDKREMAEALAEKLDATDPERAARLREVLANQDYY